MTFAERVRMLLEPCGREVIEESDREPEDEWRPLPAEGLKREGEGVLTLPLPEDFLRLGHLMMKGWKRPVARLTLTDDGRNHSDVEGVRGNASRPVAIIEPDAGGGRRLRIFCGDDGGNAEITEATYMTAPKIGADDRIGIPANLYREWLKRLCLAVQGKG